MPRRFRNGNRRDQRKRHGTLRPNFPVPASGPCWLCGRRTYRFERQWGGKYWCFRHHPLSTYRRRPYRKSPRKILYLRSEDERGVPFAHRFANSGVHPAVKGLPQAKVAKAERKVDAVLGRKKTRRSRTRRAPRDRRYVR